VFDPVLEHPCDIAYANTSSIAERLAATAPDRYVTSAMAGRWGRLFSIAGP
jgi:hypothetical protein